VGPRKLRAGKEGNEQKRAPRNEVKVQEETEAETLYPQINKNTKTKESDPSSPTFISFREEKKRDREKDKKGENPAI